MAITIQGIRLNDIHLEPDNENGGFKIKSAEYALISSTGKVLAKQNIGGYGGLVLEASPATKTALAGFAKLYTTDVQAILGLIE